jgi:UDP-N-acetylmuramyl pentapeptide synthase
MLLSKLCESFDHRLVGADLDIEVLEYDSRKVRQGSLFCCIVGTFSDGHAYAQKAVEAGAIGLLVEHELNLDVPQVVVPNSRIPFHGIFLSICRPAGMKLDI